MPTSTFTLSPDCCVLVIIIIIIIIVSPVQAGVQL